MTLWTPEATATLELRPYQEAAIEGLRHSFRQGNKRVILCAPTGAGKTEMAICLIQEANRKGSKVVFVADRIALVDQTSKRLTTYGIDHGVAQAENTFGRNLPVQVCSAQTIEKRDYWTGLDLLVIDECHTQRKKIMQFAKNWGGPVIGLSATPLTEGLGENWEYVVNATTTDVLLEAEYLAPLRIYAATEIDMNGAKKTAGEWQAGEVRERGGKIIGDIVAEWVKHTQDHFGGPVKTLAFSADVAHGEDICKAFQSAGHDFRQSSYRDDQDETRAMVEAFRRGEFTGLVSVEKFVKGFDVPDVLCMIGARPYSSSLASVIQQLGRGMRTAPGKEYCLYLDHAGNMAGWYEEVSKVWAEGVSELPEPRQAKKARKEGNERAEVICQTCKRVIPPSAKVCPGCGKEIKRRTQARTAPGQMSELSRPGLPDWAEDRPYAWGQLCALALKRKDGDMDAAEKHVKWLYNLIYRTWPSQAQEFIPAQEVRANIESHIKGRIVRWAKEQKK